MRKAAEKLRIVIESIGDMIIITDRELNYVNVNEATVRMLGYSDKEQMVGASMKQSIAERDRKEVARELAEALKEKRSINSLSCMLVSFEGKEFEVEATVEILHDCAGKTVGLVISARDVTERKRIMVALRDSEEKKRLLFESLRDGIMIVDLKGNVVEANEASVRLLGYPKEELFGINTLKFVAAKDHDRAIGSAIKLLSKGVAENYVDYMLLTLVTKEGREVEVEHSEALMRDSAGKPVAVIGISRDVTDRRRMERELLRSVEKIRLMFDSIADGLTVTGLDGNMIETNEAAVRLHGFKNKEEMLGQNGIELIAEKDRKRCFENAVKAMKSGEIQPRVEYTLMRKDGTEFDGEYTLAPMRGTSGGVEGFIAVVRDITEQKRAREALSASEEKLRIMFASMRDGIVLTDVVGNVVEVNDAAVSMHGYASKEELIGRNGIELVAERDRKRVVEEAMKQSKGESAKGLVECHALLRADGTDFESESARVMLLDSRGKPSGFLAVERDVTERRQMEEKLQHTMEELKRSNTELEQFAYVASHDLQEPLRMVSSYVQLLARRYKGKLDKDADEFIEFAVDGSGRMQAMIQALLTYSRVGTKGKPPEPTDCEVILGHVLKNLQAALTESGAEVTHEPLPVIMADGVQMVQLFQNLIGNGIKFQEEGVKPKVHISVEDNSNDWVFSFRDNGIGIDPQYQDRIFVIFQRLHGKTEYKGTGIGLAVCKRIVERHGGRIWVESEPGKGATFKFTILKHREEAKDV
jgi:PAS domain S-box-containing protein